MKLDRKQKNHLLIGLCAVVVIMAVGYAAFAQRLTINGTANVTSTWNVLITDIKEKAKSGGNSASAPTHTNTTATFSSTLTKPGDYITYEVTVENQGTIDAKLKTITKTDANNNAIVFTVDGIAENDALNAGATTTFTVKVEYSNSVTTQPSVLTSTLTLQLDYEQNTSSSPSVGPLTPQSSTQTVYSWNTDTITVGTSQLTDLVSTKTTNPYYTSEADIQSALNGKTGSTIYNKYTVENDTITEEYACQTFGVLSTAECLKMSTDGSEYGYDAGGNHTGNAGILKALQSNSTLTGASGFCDFRSDSSRCYVGNLHLYAYPNGRVSAYDTGTNARCSVYNSGSAYCSE